MRRRNGFMFVALQLTLLAGCSSSPWKEYKSPDGKFSVLLPGTPELRPEQDGWQMLSATLKADRDLLFSIRYKDFPAPLSPAEFDQMAGYSRDGLANKNGNKLLDEKPVQTGKYTGKENRIAIGQFDDVSISRSFAVANRYYSLTVTVPKKSADSPEVAKFLDSFQIKE
jgi:hypothetical protein